MAAISNRHRCNPEGILCLYMSHDRETALAEYDKYQEDPVPHLTYYGTLQAAAIIDFEDPATRKHFGLKDSDFYGSFRLNPNHTNLEALGKAISEQSRIVGIRFPSAAMHKLNKVGCNVVLFKRSVQDPDSLEILGTDKEILERWP